MFIVPLLYKVTLSINVYLSRLITIMFFTIFSADLTLTIISLIKNKRYIKNYEIIASKDTTTMFLSISFYYFIISYMMYIFIKTNFIKLKESGSILIMLYITPIIYILFYFLN